MPVASVDSSGSEIHYGVTDMKRRTQAQRIIDWLAAGKPLTPITALNRFGVFRLAARVNQLRGDGHNIVTSRVTRNGSTYAEYRLQ